MPGVCRRQAGRQLRDQKERRKQWKPPQRVRQAWAQWPWRLLMDTDAPFLIEQEAWCGFCKVKICMHFSRFVIGSEHLPKQLFGLQTCKWGASSWAVILLAGSGRLGLLWHVASTSLISDQNRSVAWCHSVCGAEGLISRYCTGLQNTPLEIVVFLFLISQTALKSNREQQTGAVNSNQLRLTVAH